MRDVTEPTRSDVVPARVVHVYVPEPRVVEISRNDALSLGIAAEGYRKMGVTPPDWMQQGADLIDGSLSDWDSPMKLTFWQALRNLLAHPVSRADVANRNGRVHHPAPQTSDPTGSEPKR